MSIKDKILSWDTDLFLYLNGDGGVLMDNVMWALSNMTSYIVMVLFFFLMLKREKKYISWKQIVVLLLSMGLIILLADQTSNFFKYNVPKFRPTHNPQLVGLVYTVKGYVGGLYGTVSAHAANGFGLAMFMSLVYKKRYMSLTLFTFVSLIAYSRIYLGVHYPLDLIFGTITGLFYGWIVYVGYSKLKEKYNIN